MNLLSLQDWINLLLLSFQSLQEGLLQGLALLGWTHNSHGQPAWPFAYRLSGEVMLIDRNVARQLLTALGLSLAAVLTLVLAICWRRARWLMLLMTVVLAGFTSWPDRQLLLSPAAPTSFHVSPTGFSAAAIVQGQQLYQQRCASCHAIDGKGDTPLGLSLPAAPPNLASGLLWRRADGELFWHIAAGLRDRRGMATMPGFARQLSDGEIWALIDFMKANAAGTSIRTIGTWDQPVALPTLTADCGTQLTRASAPVRGQRLRVILASAQQARNFPLEDPRLHSIILAPGEIALPPAQAGRPSIDCLSHSAAAWQALSIITGIASEQLAGTQLLTDRDGWLRARKLADPGTSGDNGWSASDIVCRAPSDAVAANTPAGLDGLIAQIDAEPVRFVKGGFVHGSQ